MEARSAPSRSSGHLYLRVNNPFGPNGFGRQDNRRGTSSAQGTDCLPGSRGVQIPYRATSDLYTGIDPTSGQLKTYLGFRGQRQRHHPPAGAEVAAGVDVRPGSPGRSRELWHTAEGAPTRATARQNAPWLDRPHVC